MGENQFATGTKNLLVMFLEMKTSSKDSTKNLLGMVPPYGTGLHRRNRLCDGCCEAWGVPVASLWVFNNDNGSAASCASKCTNNCGNNARNNEALRVGLFGSVAPLERYNRDQRIKVWQTCWTKCIGTFQISTTTISVWIRPFHIKGGMM